MGTTGTLLTPNGSVVAQQPPAGTKLADLIDEIGPRIPDGKIPNLIPVVNRAISILAKHLYILESDIIKGEMAMDLFAEVTYTASTISFVSGGDAGADTIIDTAGQFVIEGFKAGMPIYSNCVGNTGVVKIDSVTAGTITLRSTDKVTTAASGSSVTLTSVDNYGYLPDDFGGFISKPNIHDTALTLPGLPNQSTELSLIMSSPGTPQYSKLMGDRLKVYPGTDTDIVIEGDYWRKPAKLISMDDYIPFYGLFDDAIMDYIMAVLQSGPAGTVELAPMLTSAVDLIDAKREKRAPKRIDGRIDWEGMHE